MSGAPHHTHLLALAPPGAAFPREAGSRWGRALQPLAGEHARLEAEAEALLRETDPRDAARMLEDHERVLGEDPCLGPAQDWPIELRRRVVHRRWTEPGGATAALLVALAAALDIEVEVIESQPWEVGVAEVDDELIAEEGRFEWFVKLRLPALLGEDGRPLLQQGGARLTVENVVTLSAFEVGSSDVDTPIEGLRPHAIECLARRHAPAHTALYFDDS